MKQAKKYKEKLQLQHERLKTSIPGKRQVNFRKDHPLNRPITPQGNFPQ